MNQTDAESLRPASQVAAEAKNERRVTLVAIAYFFFVICSYYVIKPIRGSLALELGAANIPVLNILSMVSLIAGNAIYSVIVGRYKRDIFIPFITRFFVFCLLGFWALFSFVFPIGDGWIKEEAEPVAQVEISPPIKPLPQNYQQGGALEAARSAIGGFTRKIPATGTQSLQGEAVPSTASAVTAAVGKSIGEINFRPPPSTLGMICIGGYYLWVNLFALLAVSMFWSFMNDVFTVDQSRRLYAIIGYGGLLGGLVGSIITVLLARIVGTANLFLVATALLYPSIWCMRYIHQRHYKHQGVPCAENKPAVPAHPPRPWDGLVAVMHNPILILMALEMFLYTFSSTLFFQQLNQLVENAFAHDVNGRTAFVAGIYSKINVISLFTQFFVTRLVMSLSNPVYGLLMLNLIQVAGSLLMLFSPGLNVVSWTLIIRYALNYSTGRAMRELIYIPLDREAKYQGKGFIDTVVFRLGDGLSSVMLIGGLEMFAYGNWIDYSILITMAVQFYVIIRVAGLYGRRLTEVSAAPQAVVGSAN